MGCNGLESGDRASVSWEDQTGDEVEITPKGWPVPVGSRGLLRRVCWLIQLEKQNQEEIIY